MLDTDNAKWETKLYNTLFLCAKVLPIFGAMFKNVSLAF